jgi:M6 family metalloprotease-like protein
MVCLSARPALSVPACPEVALVAQPDGTAFLARRAGDETWNFTETGDGYTILQDADSGLWFYAVEKDGVLEKSSLPVGEISPRTLGLTRHMRPQRRPRRAELPLAPTQAGAPGVEGASLSYESAAYPRAPQALGSIKSLVILARFSDQMTFFTQDQFSKLFNQVSYSTDGAVGSVRDYYLEVSATKLTVDSTVSGWVTLPRNESFYGADNPGGGDASPYQLVRDAVRALDSMGFDFRPFDADGNGEIDMLTVIHSGLGQEYSANPTTCVWSQVVDLTPPETADGIKISWAAVVPERRFNTTSITRIGVVCHEMAHLLGLPDLYDSDGSSFGIGLWGLMGAGSWGGDGFSPERPVHPCCWSKVKLGWIVPTEIDGSDSPVSVPGIEKSATPRAFKISCEMGDGEYLLIENRRNDGFDLKLPGSGLLIWHIDDNQPWNDDESHYMVGLLQADGKNDLEKKANLGDAGDPFPGTGNKRSLDDTTTPSTRSYYIGPTYIAISSISNSVATMTFNISTLTDVLSETFSGGLPASWTVVDGGNDGFKWTDQNPRNRSDPNWSGKFMIADSEAAAWRTMNEQLITPEIDCSLYVHTRIKFSHSFRASGGQTGDVDVRVDGGAWQNVARYKSTDDSGTRNLDISSFADGRSSVQVRWHFYNISYGLYWGIDNARLRGKPPANSPPQITISSISQRRDGSRRLEIRFVGKDPENNPTLWATNYCVYSVSPYSTWQQLVFDTADPSNTAIEPMPFTSSGKAFVAVVDVSGWDGLYKVKLRVTDGVTSNPAVTSAEFSADGSAPQSSASTSLDTNPTSGATSVIARASWADSNPGTTWFQLKLNAGAWGSAMKGSPTGSVSQTATFTSLSLRGDDYLTVESYHVDAFGNQSAESVSPAYYVVPLTPPAPGVSNPTSNSLVVVVRQNSSERGSVDYAVYCSTAAKYVDRQTGVLINSPTWGNYSEWGGSVGRAVVSLRSKTTYSFQVVAANPGNHDARSVLSASASAFTPNTPPNPPASVVVSPAHPLTSDVLTCTVSAASPADADPEDSVSYRFTWSCPGKTSIVRGPKAGLTDTLPADKTGKGETWTCTVEAYDLYDYGPGVAASVVIGNTPPSRVSALSLSPSSPTTTSNISCLVTPASVPDADTEDVVAYRYTWTCPGKQAVVRGPVTLVRDVLLSAETTKGDVWTCTVEPYDGTDYGPPLTAHVTVVNSPPGLKVVGQRGAYAGESIELTIVGSDADGDAFTLAAPDAPSGSTFTENGDGTAIFLCPHPARETNQDVTFSASDGTDETSATVSLTFSQQLFEIASVGTSLDQGGVPLYDITWHALPGVVYSIQRSADLLSWESVASSISLPAGTTQPDWLSYHDAIGEPLPTHWFYRLVR